MGREGRDKDTTSSKQHKTLKEPRKERIMSGSRNELSSNHTGVNSQNKKRKKVEEEDSSADDSIREVSQWKDWCQLSLCLVK